VAIRRPSRSRVGILLTAVIVVPLLAACGGATTSPAASIAASAPASTEASAAPSEAAASGGILTAAWIGPCCLDVDTNNPLSAGGDAHWWDKIYGRLVTYSVKDGAYDQLIPELAESWSTSSDGLTWTIKLRDGVKWHDGEPFTADDVKYSIEVCLDPKGGGCSNAGTLNPIAGAKEFQEGAAEISGVKVVDPLTIELTTSAPAANLIDGFAETWMVPKHSLGEVPTDQHKTTDWWTTKAIGTGPFKWKTYTPGQSIELVRNDDYWRGAPKLDGIIRRQFKDPATALLAFEAGEIDFTYVTGDEVARMRESPIGTIFEGPSGVDNEISFNQSKLPEFANKDVRQAMLMAVDRQAIIDNIYGGSAQLVPCLYGLPSLTGSVEPQPFDAAAAKALLDGAGVTMKPEYIFDTYYNDPLSANVMTAIQQNWQDNLGVAVKLQPMEPSAWTARYYDNAEFEISFAGAANGPTGQRAFTYFHSSAVWPNGGNGYKGFHYEIPALDSALEAAGAEFDKAKQGELYAQACQVMHDELPWLFMWQTVRYHIVSNKLHNVILIPAAGGGSYYDAVETWTKDPS
jgi:peptide/nickel transport system substrate-binding protein